jgi:hypothetical protein
VQANTAQALVDMGSTVQSMQQDVAAMSQTIDSLRAVVAYQDTLINKLATLTNVPWPPPRN